MIVPKKKKRKLTVKQKRFVEALLTANSQKEAAIIAGYSPDTAISMASHLSTNVNIHEALAEAFEKHNLTEDRIAGKIDDGLEANKVIGYLNNKTSGVQKVSDEFIEIPDHHARHKYLDTLCKLKGHYIGKEDAPGLTMNFINLWKKSKEKGEE